MTNYTFLSANVFAAITEGSVCHYVYPMVDGFHILVDYPNGFTASITKNSITSKNSDLWEIAILYDNEICFDTPITDDVLPYLDDEKVLAYCNEIRNLTKF